MGELVKVATVKEILPGKSKVIDVKGKEVAIFNARGTFFAVDNSCLHMGGPLAEGSFDEESASVECPWHGWVYSLQSGETAFDPGKKMKTYKVKIQGLDIFLEV